jgi:transcriptional regulator with XRE-family HTH domain
MSFKKNHKTRELNIQNFFINKYKEVLPPGIGVAEELADLLNVSIDSAYRRIRGETELTIEEVYAIAKKYAISVDQIFSNRSDTVTFAYTKLIDSEKNFEAYLKRILDHLTLINKFDHKKIYYVAEEIPMFYSFFSKKLTDFKLFYWQRSVLNVPDYQKRKFEWNYVPTKLLEMAQNAFEAYLKIPCVEIWTSETVLTNLKQIQFYLDSGILTREQAIDLMQENRKMIELVQKNAESGRKNISDKTETYFLYNSEVVLGTNCIYAIMGETKYSYISCNTLNSLTTNNSEFCEETEHYIRNLERKSTLISGVAEKQRYQFFSKIFAIIDEMSDKISKS